MVVPKIRLAVVAVSLVLGLSACHVNGPGNGPSHQPPGGPATGTVPKGPGGV
jgi:hypothetical protein